MNVKVASDKPAGAPMAVGIIGMPRPEALPIPGPPAASV